MSLSGRVTKLEKAAPLILQMASRQREVDGLSERIDMLEEAIGAWLEARQ